ncbi:MAG TPA: hypothetical protein VFW89_08060 [Gemmatimonadaceae bacterium]|nr:hypothetical protein [Gemmatimonadaceae bacterium]
MLLGLNAFLYVIVAPILLGSWRKALAVVVLAVFLVGIDLASVRGLRARRGVLRGGILLRLALCILIGTLGGLVWSTVAGTPSPLVSMVDGVLFLMWLMLLGVGLRLVNSYHARHRRGEAQSSLGSSAKGNSARDVRAGS